MKTLFFFLVTLITPIITHAQWKSDIGVNVVPLIAKSLEINSEFRKYPAYSLNLSMGYSFKTGHTGFITNDVYDGIGNRQTSGFFSKAGIRFYPLSLSEKQRKSKFYVGGSLIFSQYKQTASKREWFANGDYTEDYIPVSTNGNTIFPAVNIGFTHQISRHINLDWGFQKSFVIRKNDYIGLKSRNYQPGAGSPQSDPFIGYLQGIISVRYRFIRK
jgi:hypothetical protein